MASKPTVTGLTSQGAAAAGVVVQHCRCDTPPNKASKGPAVLVSLTLLLSAACMGPPPFISNGRGTRCEAAAAATSQSGQSSVVAQRYSLECGERTTMMAAAPWVTAAVAVRRSLQEVGGDGASYARQAQQQQAAARSAVTGRSVETLVVIVAAIVLAAVLAGVLARVCGGRHVAPSVDDRDVEGWIERRCHSCLDSGLPAPAQQQQVSSKTSEAK